MQDAHLIGRATQLRNSLTPFEARLWKCLQKSQLNGFKFRRQHVIGNCIVDFFCPRKGLIVEVDGDTHDAERDARRDQMNVSRGFTTVRFANAEVGKNIEGVLAKLSSILASLPDRWPHPGPSPEGEGKRGC